MSHPEMDALYPCPDPECFFGAAGRDKPFHASNVHICESCLKHVAGMHSNTHMVIRHMSHMLYERLAFNARQHHQMGTMTPEELDGLMDKIEGALINFNVLYDLLLCPLYPYGAHHLKSPLEDLGEALDFFHTSAHELFEEKQIR